VVVIIKKKKKKKKKKKEKFLAMAVDVQDRGPNVRVVTCLVIVLAMLFVVLRLVSRFWIVRRVSSDDYFIIVAWVSCLLTQCCGAAMLANACSDGVVGEPG
jgi:hypothetical protein